MDRQKSSLVDALVRLATAQADCVLQRSNGDMLPPANVSLAELDSTLQEIQKWADLSDVKVRYISMMLVTIIIHYISVHTDVDSRLPACLSICPYLH